jgi:hypothetical protein
MTFSSDERLLALCSRLRVILFDLTTGTSTQFPGIEDFQCSQLAFSHDAKMLAAASIGGKIDLWDPAANPKLRAVDIHPKWKYVIVLSHDAKLLATFSAKDTIMLYNLVTREKVLTISYPERQSLSVFLSFSQNDRFLCCCSDRAWKICDIETGRIVKTGENSEYFIHLYDQRKTWDLTSNAELRGIQRPTIDLPVISLETQHKESEWVLIDGKRRLWLPARYRPASYSWSRVHVLHRENFATEKNVLALGTMNGQIIIITFALTRERSAGSSGSGGNTTGRGKSRLGEIQPRSRQGETSSPKWSPEGSTSSYESAKSGPSGRSGPSERQTTSRQREAPSPGSQSEKSAGSSELEGGTAGSGRSRPSTRQTTSRQGETSSPGSRLEGLTGGEYAGVRVRRCRSASLLIRSRRRTSSVLPPGAHKSSSDSSEVESSRSAPTAPG